MSRGYQFSFSVVLVGAVCSPAIFGGCAVRASYRVYDPAYEDSHAWDRDEVLYYQRWEDEKTYEPGTLLQNRYLC